VFKDNGGDYKKEGQGRGQADIHVGTGTTSNEDKIGKGQPQGKEGRRGPPVKKTMMDEKVGGKSAPTGS